MKITPVTKIAALLALCAGVALAGCTQQADDGQTETGSSENTEDGSQRNKGFRTTDFIYVTEDGTTVQCISSANGKGLSCDWEGATRPSDTEDSASDEDVESEQGQ